MAIGAGAAGAWAAVNATTQTVTLPAHAAGDLLLVIAACKAATITSVNQSCTTNGWARLAAFADGTTNSGVGTGSVNQAVFFKVAMSGAETNPVITWGGSQTAAPGIAVALGFTKASTEFWVEPVIVQAATNAATSISVTMGSNPGITSGDFGVIMHTTADDSALTVPTWTATSATLAAVVVYPVTPIASATSNDMAGTSAYRSVTSGTASAAPVVTGTQAAAETGVTGFIRLRVFTPTTKVFLTDEQADYSTGTNNTTLAGSAVGWTSFAMGTARDVASANISGVTVTGPTTGVELDGFGTSKAVWYSPPLSAAVTISGPMAWNLWSWEASASANAAINGVLDVIDGANGTITQIDRTNRIVELGTSTALQAFSETPASGVACKRGDRLRVRLFADDPNVGNMGSGVDFYVSMGSPTADVDGDSWLGLSESVTFASEPAGTKAFLTAVASAVSTASLDQEVWTTRGSGVVTATSTAVAGWTAPVQLTDTGGGTAIDWFTRPLTAFTLGGAVRVVAWASETSASINASIRCEIARVAGDGTGPTVWGATTFGQELNTGAGTRQFLVSGDDLAVSDGQRLRVRLYIDDSGDNAMAAAGSILVEYNESVADAEGDTYLVFTSTLTESVISRVPLSRQIPQLLAH